MDFPPAGLHALRDYLRGPWRFTRTIHGGDVLQAQAEGQCEFSVLDVASLAYREQGTLHMLPATRPISFTRLFDYRFDADGVEVFFADGERVGQSYQRYVLRGHVLGPAADHICGPDCYNATYTLQSPGAFLMETLIRGPKKDTRVLSAFERG